MLIFSSKEQEAYEWHPFGTTGSNKVIMIFSYFKYAFRNLLKQRGRTLINLFGLSFSIAIVVIIFLYVSRELSFDNFHKNSPRIYKMYCSVMPVDMERIYSGYQPAEMAEALRQQIPGIKAVCRLKQTRAFIGPDEDLFMETLGFVDSTFFDIFSYDIMAGDRVNPLKELKSVVLTESVARKIFQDSVVRLDDLIGRTIKFPEEPPADLYTISAIIADPPENSSFYWTVLLPYVNSRVYSRSNDFAGDTYIYVMLDKRNNLQQLEETAQNLVEEIHGEDLKNYAQMGFIKEGEHDFTYHFMPYEDTYLESKDINGGYSTKGNKTSLYILSSIAALIMLIACFNYVMISIGTALNRIGDFGLMNVVGAKRWQVLAQFVIESFLLTLISVFLGIIIAEQILPLFNNLAEENLKFTLYSRGLNFLFLFGILLFIVISTSSYIGFYLLRRSEPLHLLRREMLSVRRNGVARISIVLQFFIAIVLLISGGVIMKQLSFLVNRDVGFEKDNTAVIHVDFDLRRIQTLKEQFLESPLVQNVSMSDRNFTSGSSSQSVKNKQGELTTVRFLRVDSDYLSTLGLELIEGRNFFGDEPTDTIPHVVVNETLVRELGIEDPVGERVMLDSYGSAVLIIGVVRDFHFDSMRDDVQPLLMHNFSYNSIWYLFVKARENQMAAALKHCERVWKDIVPEFTWEYTFMNDMLEEQYKNEDRWGRIIAYAAGIAILLSCLGLMGISGLLVARRFKEVGIRKANGATVRQIIVLLNKNLLKWVFVAYVLACPAAWFAMKRWLQDFAFRTEISWWIFALAGLAAILISIFTITFQIYRVARQNPVNALRYE